MRQALPSTRRDPRTKLSPGAASVEFAWVGPDEQVRGNIITISATGLAFNLVDGPSIDVGSILTPVSIRIEDTLIHGDLIVRYARSAAGSMMEFGCLFYPASPKDTGNWMRQVEPHSGEDSGSEQLLSLRCTNCHSTVWTCVTRRSKPCPTCKQEYGFGKPILGSELEGLHQRARGMAAELEIDLPSAVSMLLGLLTLPEVRDILDESARVEPAAVAPGGERKRRFDIAFAPAIEAGTLTAAQAMQRGSREAFANKLVARHRISVDDAFAVADNQTSLLAVLRAREAGAPITAKYDRSRGPARVLSVAAVAVIALLAGLGIVTQFDRAVNRPAPGPDRRPGVSAEQPAVAGASIAAGAPAAESLSNLPVESYARIRRNERGEILGVEATDPGNVLLALCKAHGPARHLDPVDVLPTDPPSNDARIGLLRDSDGEGTNRVVVIRRDPLTRRWFVGNPDNPDALVSMFPAPERLLFAAKTSR